MSRPDHPELPGQLAVSEHPVVDRHAAWPVEARQTVYTHPYLSLDLDTVRGPDGAHFDRVYVRHHGAVGVVALDDEDRILLLEQYRHPVRAVLAELPAGILDHPGEDPQAAAARELAEEAELRAAQWQPLVRMYSSPGFSNEHWQVFLATGLSAAEFDGFVRLHEEAHMERVWVDLAAAVGAVQQGAITDGMAVAGILAAWTQRHTRSAP